MQVSTEDHGDSAVLRPKDIIIKGPSWASSSTPDRFSSSGPVDHHQYNHGDLAEDHPQEASGRIRGSSSEKEENTTTGYGFPARLPYSRPVTCGYPNHHFSGDLDRHTTTSASPTRRRKWSFRVIASLRAKPCSLASDVIAAIDFDETGSFFATGGIARKIRVCSFKNLTDNPEQETMPEDEEAEDDDDDDDDDDDYEEERHTVSLQRSCSSSSSSSKLQSSHRRRRHRRSTRSSSCSKRKIADTVLGHGGVRVVNHDEASSRMICTPAKLSSLKWRPLMGSNVIGCGDYDGVVTEWDVEQGLCLNERDEHSGQRIWSIDYSRWFPTLCASASGDGTVRLWSHNCDRSVGVIKSPGNFSVCCAEFSSDGPPKVAIACADSNVFLYDLRRLDCSLLCLQGHERAASYVRFLSDEEIVSASIDSTVRLWDVGNLCASSYHYSRNRVDFSAIPSSSSSSSSSIYAYKQGIGMRSSSNGLNLWSFGQRKGSADRLKGVFKSHRNVKNFVGLSALRGEGLIACGSEDNELYVYERSESKPLWRMKFPSFLDQESSPPSPSSSSSSSSSSASSEGKKWRAEMICSAHEKDDEEEVDDDEQETRQDDHDECRVKMHRKSESNGSLNACSLNHQSALWGKKAGGSGPRPGPRPRPSDSFVGAVCWGPPSSHGGHHQPHEHSLVTANSQGTVQLVMVRSRPVAS